MDSVKRESLIAKLERMPLAAVPTMMGVTALSNAWRNFGFDWLNNIAMIAGLIVWLLYMCKVVFHFKTCVEEYQNTVLASLYCTTAILLMIITGWAAQWEALFFPMKILHYTGAVAQMLFVLLFTYRHVLRGINPATFVPSWYVTYVGIFISPITGGIFGLTGLNMAIFWFSAPIYWLSLIPMIIRLRRLPVPEKALHTRNVLLAPPALSLTTYLVYSSNPNHTFVLGMVTLLCLTLVYVYWNVPRFFSVPYVPGMAALTFPNVAATLTLFYVADYFLFVDSFEASWVFSQLAGIQMFLTTAVVVFVAFNLWKMGIKGFLAKRPPVEEKKVA